MARRKKAAPPRMPQRVSARTQTRTNTRTTVAVTEQNSTRRSSPLPLRRSSRIRNAAIARQQAAETINQAAPQPSMGGASDPSNATSRHSSNDGSYSSIRAGSYHPSHEGPRDPSSGGLNPSPPARPSNPTLSGMLSAGPPLENLLDYLNEWDRRSLICALPLFRDALRHPQVRPRFTCQNYPDHACLKIQNAANHLQLALTEDGLVRGQCTTPAQAPQGPNAPAHLRRAALVRQQNCNGFELGYTTDPLHQRPHGQYFWVCEVCARKAWEHHSVLHEPRAIDLCLNCSHAHRAAHGNSDIDQCTCLWDQSADKIHLCTDCREFKAETDIAEMLHWVHTHLMTPIHDPRGLHIKHYIDEHQRIGESTCTCGMPVLQKITSHILAAPTTVTFDQMVRICVHCHKERFLTFNDWK